MGKGCEGDDPGEILAPRGEEQGRAGAKGMSDRDDVRGLPLRLGLDPGDGAVQVLGKGGEGGKAVGIALAMAPGIDQ